MGQSVQLNADSLELEETNPTLLQPQTLGRGGDGYSTTLSRALGQLSKFEIKKGGHFILRQSF